MKTRTKLIILQQSRTTSVGLLERASIVLLADEGMENVKIAERLNISRKKVWRWRDKFIQYVLKGIEKDAPRPDRIQTFKKKI